MIGEVKNTTSFRLWFALSAFTVISLQFTVVEFPLRYRSYWIILWLF
jgi:hypothetical protein